MRLLVVVAQVQSAVMSTTEVLDFIFLMRSLGFQHWSGLVILLGIQVIRAMDDILTAFISSVPRLSLGTTIPVQEPNEIGMVQLDNDDYQTVGN
jgi:hypothetical protein